MNRVFLIAIASLLLASCSNNSETVKPFCDTTCNPEGFYFRGSARYGASVRIFMEGCLPDTIAWTHRGMSTNRQMPFSNFTDQEIRLNASAINCFIKDTSYAWLTFNDCITGRGFLFKLPFNKANNITKISGALNSFDPKFFVEEDLRAYTDRGSIFVVNMITGKQEVMTFKEVYDIDFNKIHDIVDSVNVTHKNIYVKLLKDGKEVVLQKAIEL